MRTRKKELEALVNLLEDEHDDVYELAEAVWKLVDEQRRQRDVWVVGMNYDGIGQFLFGCYDSEANARKDIEGKGNIHCLREGDVGKVFKVLAPTKIFAEYEQHELFDYR